MQDAFKTVAAAATVLIVGLYIVSAIFGTMPASETHAISNESITVDVGNNTQVAESYGTKYYDNETVRNASGTTLTEGTDYEWYPSNASIHWYSTSSVNDGATANVSYAFDSKPAAARNSIGTIGNSFTLGAVAVIVVVAALILNAIGGFGASGGGGGRRL